MLRVFGLSLLFAVIAGGVVTALKWVGAFDVPIAKLAQFFEHETIFKDAPPAQNTDKLQLALVFGLPLFITLVTVDLVSASKKIALFLGTVFLTVTASPVLALHGMPVEPFSSVASLALGFLPTLFMGSTELIMRKSALTKALGRRVSPETFAALVEAPEPLELDGESRDVTVITCRMLNSEKKGKEADPAIAMLGVNALERVPELLLKSGACLDESSPDVVRAFFGMPIADDGHAVAGCLAALEIQSLLEGVEKEASDIGGGGKQVKLHYGIAVESGEMKVGTREVEKKSYYTATGHEIDLARRLCGANAKYGSRILIGGGCQQRAASKIEVRPMEMLSDPDERSMSEIYELLGKRGELTAEEAKRRDAFWEGVVYLRGGDGVAARKRLELAAPLNGSTDRPLEYFKKKAAMQNGDGKRSGDPFSDKGHARAVGGL